MIINGASRSNGAFFSRHLMRADENERVAVKQIRGLSYAEDVPTAFREMKELAEGTSCKNYFYHANINTRADERLSPEQWAQAIDSLERGLGFTDQPRLIVEHEKEGRVHCHVIWSRIDQDSRTAISDSHNYRTHELVASELETSFGHEATARALTRDKTTQERPEPNVKDWESFRAADSQIDPKAMKAELTELWQHSDGGPAFAAALEERGYILARGDRRDFCVIDAAGDEHSLGRRISGVKAAEIRSRMADIDPSLLPSVEEGRALARARQEAEGSTSAGSAADGAPSSPFDAILDEAKKAADPFQATAAQVEPTKDTPATDAFRQIVAETARQAEAHDVHAAEEERAAPGGRWQRFQDWWGGMREYVTSWGQQVQDYWSRYFHHDEPSQAEPETPGSSVTGATLAPDRSHEQSPGWTPGL